MIPTLGLLACALLAHVASHGYTYSLGHRRTTGWQGDMGLVVGFTALALAYCAGWVL
jgi:hypothetical protein